MNQSLHLQFSCNPKAVDGINPQVTGFCVFFLFSFLSFFAASQSKMLSQCGLSLYNLPPQEKQIHADVNML